MTKTREQLEGEAALARLQRALAGKPQERDRTFDMPDWLADLMHGKDMRSDER